jgi:hypothetical protein
MPTPTPNLIPMPSATMLRIVKVEGCPNCRAAVSQAAPAVLQLADPTDRAGQI